MTAGASSLGQDASEVVLAFSSTIFRRADGIEDVVPRDFVPDWQDRPAMYRCYEQATRLPLPSQAVLHARYARQRQERRGRIDAGALSTLLYLMAAPLRRKLNLSWNAQEPASGFNQQEYRRGTASGGGLYPTQIHFVGGGSAGGVVPGIYHYTCGHHALTPLRRGDYRGRLAAALPGTQPIGEAYLVLTSDFWQNCFKYHNFGYHVCSQDVGAMIATAHLAAEALGIQHRVHLTFDDAAMERLVAVDPEREGVLAVIALGGAAPDAATGAVVEADPGLPVPAPRQRSRVVEVSPAIRAMHAATRCREPLPQDPVAPTPADPFDGTLFDALPDVLMRRQSGWGSMSGAPLPVGKLATLLGFMSRRVEASGAVRDPLPDPDAMQLVVQANDVAGLARGAYRWDAAAAAFAPVASQPPSRWQSTYSMLNYNIDSAGCVLFVTGDLPRLMARYGPAGYRVLNAHVGLLAQLGYVGAAALDLDCGAVLGVCAQKVKGCVALAPGHEVLLALYFGGASDDARLFDFRIVPGGKA